MTTNVTYRNFKPAQFWRNKYLRNDGMFEIWDANLHHGDVRPFACPEMICEIENTVYKELYPIPECPCIGFEEFHETVKGFSFDQFFHLKDGYLVQSTTDELCSGEYCRAGAPRQPATPTASSNCSGCDGAMVSYVITYLTKHAGIYTESSPSKASTPVTSQGNVPNVTVSWAAAPASEIDFCIVGVRLYRVTSSFLDVQAEVNAREYVLVAEIVSDGSAGSYHDSVSTSSTGDPLITRTPERHAAPGNLVSLTRCADGLAVADNSRVYISMPGQAMFTADGVVEIEDNILDIEAIGNSILVLTDHQPVTITFSHGDAINVDRSVINRDIPLKSKSSVSAYAGSVYFSSTYSLYVWNPGRYGANVATPLQSLITPEQWKNIDPTTVIGTAYEYGYFFTADELDYSVMVEFGEDGTDTANATSMMPISYINPKAVTTNHDGIIIYQDEDLNIYSWDWRRDVCSEFMLHDHVRPNVCERCNCCQWSLKLYYDNEGKNHFSHMRVEWDERSADHIDLSFHIHEFGREIDRTDIMEVVSSRGFGIPYYNVSYQSVYAYLTGCAIMHEVRFATSAQELTNNSNAQVA